MLLESSPGRPIIFKFKNYLLNFQAKKCYFQKLSSFQLAGNPIELRFITCEYFSSKSTNRFLNDVRGFIVCNR